MKSNIFYFKNINSIGGVETFFWYLARKYSDHDISIYYQTADPEQVKRLKEYVRVIKWTGERIRCKKVFFCYKPDIIDYVDADEYYQILHADYKAIGIKPIKDPKIEKLIGVSEQVSEQDPASPSVSETTKAKENPETDFSFKIDL